MRISLNWLKEFVDVKKIEATTLAATLTDIGLEVETLESTSILKGEVVVGEILKAEKHPDADSLRVCEVNVGAAAPLPIVCGAANARAGIKACVALVGSTLPGDFKIKKSKIRGVVSEGMMCAEDELGLSKNHDAIIELPSELSVGSSVAQHFGLCDEVFSLGITPNRGDCLSVIGVARDLGAKLAIPLTLPPRLSGRASESLSTPKVVIASADDCPRFSLLRIDQLVVADSPAWLQRRLTAVGVRPINNIVDVTNYVMFEWGQPVHAYDTRRMGSGTVTIRRGRNAESFATLDGQLRTLTTEDLVVCDGDQPVALAGVMGGASTEVREDTTSILLEVANFDPRLVRKTSKRLALHTEASHRFERGCDASACAVVAERVAALLQQIAVELGHPQPVISATACDEFPGRKESPRIALRLSRTRQILGKLTVDPGPVIDKLSALGLVLVDQTSDRERMLFQIPTWRHDLTREIDLIEEVGRMLGYDEIPYLLPQVEMGGLREHPLIQFIDTAKQTWAQLGFNEIISFPFVGDQDFAMLRLSQDHPLQSASVALVNPLAEQEGRLRTSMLMGLIKASQHNRRLGVRGTRLFECGRCFYRKPTHHSGDTQSPSYLALLQRHGLHLNDRARQDDRVIEANVLAAMIDQPLSVKTWQSDAEQPADFFAMKRLLLSYLQAYAVRDAELGFETIDASELPFLHPGAAALIKVRGATVGFIGELHPEVAQLAGWPAKESPVVVEILLDQLYLKTTTKIQISDEEQKFPSFNLDLAFVVAESLRFADLQAAIKAFKPRRFLRDFRLFDVYQGPNLAAGKKSVALAFSFASDKKTLSDRDVEPEVTALKAHLQQQLGAELR